LALMNPQNESVVQIREMPERGARMYGRFVLSQISLKPKAEIKKDDKNPLPTTVVEEDEGPQDLHTEVRFEVKEFIQNKLVWTRDFPKDAPRYSFDEYSGRLILYWSVLSEGGKAKLKESPELQARAASMGDKQDDYLLEVIDAYSQKTIGMMLLETGKGSFDVGSGQSEADWVVFYDSADRVLVYSLKDGMLKHRFFGKHAAINPKRNQVAVENFPGEINLYDLDTGESQAKVVFNGKAAFVRFNLEGDKLFVLSDSQTAYSFDLKKIPAAGKPVS
jgi:hypothetical protein